MTTDKLAATLVALLITLIAATVVFAIQKNYELEAKYIERGMIQTHDSYHRLIWVYPDNNQK